MRGSFITLFLFIIAVTLVAFYSSDVESRAGGAKQPSLDNLVSMRTPLPADGRSAVTDGSVAQPEPTMAELVQLAEQLLDHLRSDVQDYTATLVKRERIGGDLAAESRIELKLRNPLPGSAGPSVYLKFSEPAAQRGREVIWVAGKNKNKLVAHEGGFLNLLRVELDPHGTLAMVGNKYPITEIGLIRLLEKMLEKIDRDVDLSRCEIETRENQRVGDRECRLIQVTQPRSVPGADFYIAQFFLDTERQLPLRYASFLWPEKEGDPPPLEEEYTYLNLKTNVGLSDTDFDPDNADYKFP